MEDKGALAEPMEGVRAERQEVPGEKQRKEDPGGAWQEEGGVTGTRRGLAGIWRRGDPGRKLRTRRSRATEGVG